jgi:hypothetical protein
MPGSGPDISWPGRIRPISRIQGFIDAKTALGPDLGLIDQRELLRMSTAKFIGQWEHWASPAVNFLSESAIALKEIEVFSRARQ